MFPGHSEEGSFRRLFVKYLLLYGFCLLALVTATPVLAQTASLSWIDLAPGSGQPVALGHVVEVSYVGKFPDGKVFDRSHTRGAAPFRFVYGVTRLIPGWITAVDGMMPGGHRIVAIPPSLAYGEGGLPGIVPPHATLVYDIEILKVD
jgi:peptidylprolyl isomerase